MPDGISATARRATGPSTTWCDHQAALDLSGVHESVQDQCGLNRVAEADFAGEEPPNRIGRARALCDIELVRKEANPPPRKVPRPSASRSVSR